MENASKALIMVATVLIGVMIVSAGVYLFNILGGFSAETNQKLEDNKITQFNNQFTKFEGSTECRIHDIISLAYLAYQNNNSYEYYDLTLYTNPDYEKLPYYITVAFKINSTTINHVENHQDEFTDYLDKYSLNSNSKPQNFKCKEVEFNENTKLVKKIFFELL